MFIWLRIIVATPTIMIQILHVILTLYLERWNGPYMYGWQDGNMAVMPSYKEVYKDM